MADSEPKSVARGGDKTPPKPDVYEAIVAHIAESKGVSMEAARAHLAKLGEPEAKKPGAPSIEEFLAPEPLTVFYVVKDDGRNGATGKSETLKVGSQKSAYSDREGERVLVRPLIELPVDAIMDPREMMFPPQTCLMRFDVAKSIGIRVTPDDLKEYPDAELRESEYPEAYTLRDAMRKFTGNIAVKSMIRSGQIRTAAEVRMLISDKVQEWKDAMNRWNDRGQRGPKPTVRPISRSELGWPEKPSGAVAAGRVTIKSGDPNDAGRNLSAIPAMV